jgi:hypothetical protein
MSRGENTEKVAGMVSEVEVDGWINFGAKVLRRRLGPDSEVFWRLREINLKAFFFSNKKQINLL